MKEACAPADIEEVFTYDPELKACTLTTTTTYHDGQANTMTVANVPNSQCCDAGEAQDNVDLMDACCPAATDNLSLVWHDEHKSCISEIKEKEGGMISTATF